MTARQLQGLALVALTISTCAFVRIGAFNVHSRFLEPTPHLKGARPTRGVLSLHANSNKHDELRSKIAATLGSAIFAASLPAFAQQPAMPPPMVQQQEVPAAAPVQVQGTAGEVQDIMYSDFFKAIERDKIEKVTFSYDGLKALAVDVEGNRFKLEALPYDPGLLKALKQHKVDIAVLPKEEASKEGEFVRSLIFPALLFGGLFLLSRRNQQAGDSGPGGPAGVGGGLGGPMGMSKSVAKVEMQANTGVTFKDVVGIDAPRKELEEVVQFLTNPDPFLKMGARIPRGVLLDGPPGTGKTMLARAVAGEAGVPFFSTTGSEFVEVYVGVGAARVRDLFAQAKKAAPCIIFIDEIDAIGGRRRGGRGNSERETTLNQMLIEMDGFQSNSGIIVIAATNRPQILDPALVRAGRFDRKIRVNLPDLKGRIAILGIHSRGKPVEPDVNMNQIARRCPGFSGAQLKNLMNEAAIFAARRNKTTIGNDEVSDALDRVTLGVERKSAVVAGTTKRLVAYHEAGHAIVGAVIPDYDQVAKVSIIPRGGAGGLTFFAPNEARLEFNKVTRQYLEGQMAVAWGGRAAEEVVYGLVGMTRGASNDIDRVHETATMMVTELGMSEGPAVGVVGIPFADMSLTPKLIGQLYFDQKNSKFPVSQETRKRLSIEVTRLVDESHKMATEILNTNRKALDALAMLLLERETIGAEELEKLLEQYEVKSAKYGLYPV